MRLELKTDDEEPVKKRLQHEDSTLSFNWVLADDGGGTVIASWRDGDNRVTSRKLVVDDIEQLPESIADTHPRRWAGRGRVSASVGSLVFVHQQPPDVGRDYPALIGLVTGAPGH